MLRSQAITYQVFQDIFKATFDQEKNQLKKQNCQINQCFISQLLQKQSLDFYSHRRLTDLAFITPI